MHGRRGPVHPAGVHEVLFRVHERDALRFETGAGRARPGEVVAAGVEADARTIAQLLRQPGQMRRFNVVQNLEAGGVYLLAHLFRVAAVDKDRRPVGEHDRHPSRASETRGPAQALVFRRQVFTQVLIGPGHHQRVQAQIAHAGAEPGQSFLRFAHRYRPRLVQRR